MSNNQFEISNTKFHQNYAGNKNIIYYFIKNNRLKENLLIDGYDMKQIFYVYVEFFNNTASMFIIKKSYYKFVIQIMELLTGNMEIIYIFLKFQLK